MILKYISTSKPDQFTPPLGPGHRLALVRNEVEARDIKTAARINNVGKTTTQPPGYKLPATKKSRNGRKKKDGGKKKARRLL